jgi:demethylmenaquinone methyltransferase / 2-methoxy-6-polyprenyl-1,4-benzoquinol methylase
MKNSEKKIYVEKMFNGIAHRYDFLNHLLSMGIDKIWRNRAIKLLKDIEIKSILDVATGTGDFAISALKLNPEKIIGIDISEKMLEIGKNKILKKKLNHIISLEKGDSENIIFENGSFDLVISAFGVRNFGSLEIGLSEMYRVLNPKGVILILEFSNPEKFPVKQIFNLYFNKILPLIGKIISSDNSAYRYLPDSVSVFPYGGDFIEEMKEAGFKENKYISLSFGIATIYIGSK